MCLCDSPHGRVLVHRGAAAGCDSSVTSPPFPFVWNHAIQRRKNLQQCADFVFCRYILSLCHPTISGVRAIPEGHKHVVCGGPDVCGRCGALEPAQAHRLEGAALGRCASSTVSHSLTCHHSRFSLHCIIEFRNV